MTSCIDYRRADLERARNRARARAMETGRPWVVVGLDSVDDGRTYCAVEPDYFNTGECEAFNGAADVAYLPDGSEVCPYEEGII